MIEFGESKCKYVDKIAELKRKLQKSKVIIDELCCKVLQLVLPFCEESLKDNSIVNFYTGLPNLKVVTAILTMFPQLYLTRQH